jgi:peptide/nickel transport system substrate-binding protein
MDSSRQRARRQAEIILRACSGAPAVLSFPAMPGGSLRWLAIPAAFAAGACQDPPPVPSSQVLRAAVRADVTGFFPHPPAANESYTFEMNRWVVDPVVGLDRGLNVVPALAAHWLTADDRTLVLELRPGLRFSDGRPLTAADVATSLDAGRRLAWPNDGYLAPIESVRALDERRVEVRAQRPDPTLLARLAWGFVVPREVPGSKPGPVPGTAPYVLESWTPGKGFAFARNPHHWGPPSGFARAEFRVEADDAERMRLVESGEADVADFVPPEAWPRLEKSESLQLVVGAGLRVLFLGLRVDRPPFRDPRVREALDLAIDRNALLERVFLGKGQVANQLMPRGSVGFVPELPPASHDPERARRLLAEAGLRPGHALRLDGPRNRYVRDVQILDEVARQLGEVGLAVQVNAVEKSALYDLLDSGRSDFFLLGWASESGDGADVFEVLFPHPGETLRGNSNATGFTDPLLDAITREAQSTANLRERAVVLRNAFERLASLRPILPLVVQPDAVVYDRRRVRWDPPVSLALRPRDLRPAQAVRE